MKGHKALYETIFTYYYSRATDTQWKYFKFNCITVIRNPTKPSVRVTRFLVGGYYTRISKEEESKMSLYRV